MEEDFISDRYFFNPEISALIDSNSKEDIVALIETKHKREQQNGVDFQIKQIDLFSWNVVFIREILKKGTFPQNLHILYNRFFKKISMAITLKELQSLEIELASAYLDLLIYNAEVTDSFMVNKMLQYLHMNIENYTSVETLADSLKISKGYASECFKKHMKVTIMQYSKKIKVDRAKLLLMSTTKSILEISISLGFYDQSHFTRTFKQFVGQTPSEYRNNNYLQNPKERKAFSSYISLRASYKN